MVSLKEMNKSLSMSRVVMKSIVRQRELWRHDVDWGVRWWRTVFVFFLITKKILGLFDN